jgi:hypothetical protein
MNTSLFKNMLKYGLFLAIGITFLAGCKKELDAPPVPTLPVGEVLTVQQLRALLPVEVQVKRFVGDSSVFAVVTADEQNGNQYKNVYVQDHTAAIQLRLQNSGGLYQGDSIRIYLRGTVLSRYQGMLQLDSVDVDNNIVKQATQVAKAPLQLTLHQLDSIWNSVGGQEFLQAKLIKVNDVEFAMGEACFGATYADAIGQNTINRMLTDCDEELIVRTSGYANFAGQQLPTGHGSITGVLGQFLDDAQLFIRDINEVQLNNADRCAPCPMPCPPVQGVNENFSLAVANVDIIAGTHTTDTCWQNQPTVGSRLWRGYSVSGDMAAQATAFGSSNAQDITWLVTPPVTYSSGMTLSFRSQRGFGVASHDPFALFISTNYLISPASATWTPVTSTYATPATADQVWVQSGNIDLGQFLPAGFSGSFVIGFRYTGSDPGGQTTNFRIDDVVIQ